MIRFMLQIMWLQQTFTLIDANWFCDNVTIPLTLCWNIFPKQNTNPNNVRSHQIPGTSCYYRKHCHFLVITSSSYKPDSCCSIPPNTTQYDYGSNNAEITDFAIENTNITSLDKGVFQTWYEIQILHITLNLNLIRLKAESFKNLTKVWNLTISDNPKLGPLEEDTFKGLVNLQELRYLRNNLIHIDSVTVALNPLILPNLTVLVLTGNRINHIKKDDFKPLKNTKLYGLVLGVCKIEWIHREAFDYLDKLAHLDLQRNNLNSSTLTPLVNRMVNSNKNFTHLNVGANLLQSGTRDFLSALSQNNSKIYHLVLRNNHIGVMNTGFFPQMPKMRYLDLTEVMLDDIIEGVLTHELMPSLESLSLGKNIFRGLKNSMITKTISQLILSANNNNLPWTTFFDIDPLVFTEMENLKLLDLTGNTLNILLKRTFKQALALKILILRKTSLYEIKEGAFETNINLIYLDLSGNTFPLVNPFKKEIFRGLKNLEALDLSDCQISSIENTDVFQYLPKLQYLSLRKNSIRSLTSSIFSHIPKLAVLDLRYNIYIEWNTRMFTSNMKLNITILDYNHIQTITEVMMEDFFLSKVVTFYGNSIQCECGMMNTIKNVMKKRGIYDVTTLPFNKDMNTCMEMGNAQRQTIISYLSMVNSAECLNKEWIIIVSTTLVTLLITSLIAYVIYYYYKYDIHFWFLRMKRKLGLLRYIGSEENKKPQDMKYDAFVSYCKEDEKFVEKMVYILEKEKFNLCIFERDFQVGDVLTDKIVECMENSKRTILVLTESFAKSQWCCWEMYMAENRSISLSSSDPNDTLILIKKSKIPESLMTPTLKYLMKTRVYLEWHYNPAKQKVFWEQLKKALSS